MARQSVFLFFIVYLFTAIFLYRPILNSFFVSDDFDWVSRAKNIPLTFENYFLRNADGKLDSAVYRPLTSLSFWVNYQVNGLAQFGYHLVNVFLHLGSAFLLFWLVWQLSGRTNRWLAFLTGLFFLIFPNHPEAVSWISGRNDVLAVFFFLSSFNFYVLFRSTAGRRWQFGASILFFALAIFSKEMAISLSPIILLYELIFFPWRGRTINHWIKKMFFILPFVLLSLIYIWSRSMATGLLFNSYSNTPLSLTLKGVSDTFIRSFLSHFIDPSLIWLSHAAVNHAFLFLLSFLLLILFLGRQIWIKNLIFGRFYLFGALFFVLALGPVYGFRLSRITSEGERFVYLPSIGMAIFLSVIVVGLWKKQRAAGAILAAILIVYFSFTLWQRNLIWQNAGVLSRQLLTDFAIETGLKPGEGTVVMGLPDNIDGAYVFRNGWITALKLYYPAYSVDVLPTKALLNLSDNNFNKKVIDWTVLPDGYRASTVFSNYLFAGPAQLDSADYLLKINNYDIITKAGNETEFHFTSMFIAQLSSKTINFLAFNEGRLKKIDPIVSVYKENSN